jgi:serralysin
MCKYCSYLENEKKPLSANFEATDASAIARAATTAGSGQAFQSNTTQGEAGPQALAATGTASRVTETTDAAANTTTTYSLAIGKTAQGQVGSTGDHDWFKVNLVAGQTYTFAMVATGVTTVNLDDTYLVLRNSAGTQIAADDDAGPGTNSTITFTATTSGTYYLDAGSYNNGGTGQYGVSATEGTKASYDELMGAGALIRPGVSWSTPGTAANVTWGVRTSNSGQTDASGNATAFIGLTAVQIAAVQAALAQYSEVGNITFTQVNPGGTTNNATMLFGAYSSNSDGAGAYAQYPGTAASAGDVSLNNTSVSTTSIPTGSYSAFAILHETGHAVGLAHPGDYNAAPGQSLTYADNAQFTQDDQQYSVMSYFDESNTTTSYNSYPDTLMLYDILAVQQLYGANMSTRSGNTVYGFNTNAGSIYNFTGNATPAFSIWDGGGTDTIDASGYNQNQVIDLHDGTFSNIGGLNGNVSIAFNATIENAIGGSGADNISGNAVSNVLTGGSGADNFYFKDPLSAALNVDTITDFSVADDTIWLDPAVFAALSPGGALSADAFYSGASAHDATDRILYDSNSGAISYDSDGTGSAAAVRFANVSAGLVLTNADFRIAA